MFEDPTIIRFSVMAHFVSELYYLWGIFTLTSDVMTPKLYSSYTGGTCVPTFTFLQPFMRHQLVNKYC